MSDARIEASSGRLFFTSGPGVENEPLSLAIHRGEKSCNSVVCGSVRQGSNSLALAIKSVVDLSPQNNSDLTRPPFCSTTSRPTI